MLVYLLRVDSVSRNAVYASGLLYSGPGAREVEQEGFDPDCMPPNLRPGDMVDLRYCGGVLGRSGWRSWRV